jgi:hypothetical protein
MCFSLTGLFTKMIYSVKILEFEWSHHWRYMRVIVRERDQSSGVIGLVIVHWARGVEIRIQ